jgi:hypothetical protein
MLMFHVYTVMFNELSIYIDYTVIIYNHKCTAVLVYGLDLLQRCAAVILVPGTAPQNEK